MLELDNSLVLADMEGVQEKIAEMVKETFIITSGQYLTNALLDNGEKPSYFCCIKTTSNRKSKNCN